MKNFSVILNSWSKENGWSKEDIIEYHATLEEAKEAIKKFSEKNFLYMAEILNVENNGALAF